MRRLTCVAVSALVLALPANAIADIRFRGQSAQNRLVTLRTDDAGMLVRFGVRYFARCRQPGMFFTTGVFFRRPFDSVTRDAFVDAGITRLRPQDGIRAITNVRVAGTRISERRWRGVFRSRVRVFRGDRLIDRCYVRTRWRVRRRG